MAIDNIARGLAAKALSEAQGGGSSDVVINLANVERLTQDQFYAIKQKQAKVTYDDIDLLLSKLDEENDYPILTSTVCWNEYLQVTFTEVNENEVPYYTFEVITVPVMPIVLLNEASGTLTQEELDKILGGGFVYYNNALLSPSGNDTITSTPFVVEDDYQKTIFNIYSFSLGEPTDQGASYTISTYTFRYDKPAD